MSETVSVKLTQQSDYQFLIDFGGALPQILADEPPPLGQGMGPKPDHLLLAALANCLSASLLFALRKFKLDPGGITAVATGTVERNAEKRLRIVGVRVEISLGGDSTTMEHLDRVLSQFESFCTVSQSVEAGIPIQVGVTDGKGVRLK